MVHSGIVGTGWLFIIIGLILAFIGFMKSRGDGGDGDRRDGDRNSDTGRRPDDKDGPDVDGGSGARGGLNVQVVDEDFPTGTDENDQPTFFPIDNAKIKVYRGFDLLMRRAGKTFQDYTKNGVAEFDLPVGFYRIKAVKEGYTRHGVDWKHNTGTVGRWATFSKQWLKITEGGTFEMRMSMRRKIPFDIDKVIFNDGVNEYKHDENPRILPGIPFDVTAFVTGNRWYNRNAIDKGFINVYKDGERNPVLENVQMNFNNTKSTNSATYKFGRGLQSGRYKFCFMLFNKQNVPATPTRDAQLQIYILDIADDTNVGTNIPVNIALIRNGGTVLTVPPGGKFYLAPGDNVQLIFDRPAGSPAFVMGGPPRKIIFQFNGGETIQMPIGKGPKGNATRPYIGNVNWQYLPMAGAANSRFELRFDAPVNKRIVNIAFNL